MSDVLGKCMGTSFGRGIDVVRICDDTKVSEKAYTRPDEACGKVEPIGDKDWG